MTRHGKLMLTAVLLTAAFVVWGINYLYKESALPYSNDAEYLAGGK